ncbi:hypothetical protein [Mycobacterium pseudokansasii]|uniref:hypothetical protein n=1 Tax=Mycobacterium pseudokansasii TaxID=2341080 RepID=UPI0023F4EAA5|nr:hypothetical protein [Mycobacterium pseudokansasii]
MAHRASNHVAARRPRFEGDRDKKHDATQRFLAAATGGDINELMTLLAPEVTLWCDGGGKVRQALRPIHGARKALNISSELISGGSSGKLTIVTSDPFPPAVPRRPMLSWNSRMLRR